MNDREAFEARMRKASTSDLTINRFGNYRSSYVQNKWNEFKSGWQAALASQAQQESKLHWCGTCEQNVERGCGDSACQYRYKLPSAPKGE